MRYILSAILIIFLTGCVHTYSEKEVSAKYNLPQAFRNQSYINELNDNKTSFTCFTKNGEQEPTCEFPKL